MMKRIRDSTSSDRISELPDANLLTILEFLPLRDAVRTSVLSRQWRFMWAKVPKLVFDDNIDFISRKEPVEIIKWIYGILLLHQGPILEFVLDIKKLASCCDSDIDKIVIFLSRNGIFDLTLKMEKGENDCFHKLPSYIFSCQELVSLSLTCFAFKPSESICFKSLVWLQLFQVELNPVVCISGFPFLKELIVKCATVTDELSIDLPNLKYLFFDGIVSAIGFIKTPLLKFLSLFNERHENCSFDLNNFLCSGPLVQTLKLSIDFLKNLPSSSGVGNIQPKLPIMLNSLQEIRLWGIDFDVMDELSSSLSLIFSSPNLRYLQITVSDAEQKQVNTVLDFLALQDASCVSLIKLRHVDFEYVTGKKTELEFVKFLLAISPELLTIDIFPESSNTDISNSKILMEIARFPRASRKAELIFHGLGER